MQSEALELGLGARRTPQAIFSREAADQLAGFKADCGPAGLSARFPAPEQAPALTVPANDGRGLDHDQATLPAAPEAAQEDPPQAVTGPDAGSRHAALEHGELLAKRKVFERECGARHQEHAERIQETRAPGIGAAAWRTSAGWVESGHVAVGTHARRQD